MAQELLELGRHDAVRLDSSGFYCVDYALLDVEGDGPVDGIA